MTAPRVPLALALVALLLGGLALALTLPPRDVPGLVDLRADDLPPPPELQLASPADGDGVGATVVLSGTALSASRAVLDVQYRLDGARWQSAPLAARGQRSVPFEATVDVPPGTHVLEVRAYDGEALSLPALVQVRRDAPTVRILEPDDGAGVPSGPLAVSGIARNATRGLVLLSLDGGEPLLVPTTPGGAWTTTLEVPAGEHVLRAVALGERSSLPHEVRFAAADDAPPPTVTLTLPRPDASYGENGDDLCPGGCILVGGASRGARLVELTLDGRPLADAEPLPTGAWSASLPTRGLANGTHELRARPVREDGLAGVERSVRFLARTPVTLEVRGATQPQPTGTVLAFDAVGAGASEARWLLDGAPTGEGSRVEIVLQKPGDHVLSVSVAGSGSEATSASVPLHAINRPPTLALRGEPVAVNGSFVFRAEASDPDGRIVEYQWDFGDGTRAVTREPNATHRYAERGERRVTLTAVDDVGANATLETLLLVANGAPVARFDWEPAEPTVLDAVTLTDASIDHDGTLADRVWLLPDGNVTSEEAPTLRLRERGPHAVTLRVSDELGAIGELTREIVVRNLPPEPAFRHEPAVPLTHEEVLFVDASLDEDGPIASWTWDFGDNATANGSAALHVFRAPGEYPVRLTVVDDAGAVVEVVRNVTVADSAPQVRGVVLDPETPVAQQPVRLRVDADDRDGSIVAALWDLGDGANASELEPVHRYARSGHYVGNVTVIDAGGLRANLTFLVTVLNAPPTATLRVLPGGSIAAFPTTFAADARDPDGRVTYYRFDADGDGRPDCETTEPTCAYTYERPGVYAASLLVEDDEGGIAQTQVLVDVTPPPPDTPPPRVRVEAPASSATLRGDHLFRGSASGPRDIVRVDLQMRAAGFAYSGSRDPWRLATGGDEWHVLVDTRGFADGEYDLVVRALDSAGGVGYARVPVSVQNGPRPSEVTVKLLEPPAIVESDASIRGSAFHPSGVTSVRWRIDTGDWVQEGEDPLAFTIDLDRDRLGPGEHVLQVEAYAGVRESASAVHVFTVPGRAPALVVDVPPNAVAYGLILASGRIVGDGHAQWRLDRNLWEDLPGTKEWNLSVETLRYRGGNHVLGLRAVSPDGRLTSPVTNYTVQVVNPPFTESVTSAPSPPSPAAVPGPGLALVLAAALALARVARRPRGGP